MRAMARVPVVGSALGVSVVVFIACGYIPPHNQIAVRGQAVYSLKSIPVPAPNLGRYVHDEKALVVLGKALFWDMQLSSDSRVACASCHFHAGADHRVQNQLSSTKDPVPPNQVLGPKDVPLGRGAMDAGWRVGSAGMFPRLLSGIGPGGLPDSGSDIVGREYQDIDRLNVRQVTARNAPSVINSVYSFRHFWDGRASSLFTGRTPFGDSDPGAHVLVERNGALAPEKLRIERAGLASQAMEPPLAEREMSYRGRTWPMLGQRMLAAHPLALQMVAPDDSVLGPYANAGGRGLASGHNYLALIRASFQPEYWRSSELVDGSGTAVGRRAPTRPLAEFTQAEYNFALFFGLAIQAYESTLISDESRYDLYLDGKRDALTYLELKGREMFQRRACASCHVDPELTLATYRGVEGDAEYAALGPDAGFFHTGVEPIANDSGFGGTDGFGNFISTTARKRPEMARWMRGFFKTPSLRNVELTGPYFHTGSKATLEDIVFFYTFAGDYSNTVLQPWGPDPNELLAMPAFMKTFTDDRVRFERAPFDHPELCVSTGHMEDQGKAVPNAGAPRSAADRRASILAVGAKGNSVPLQTFEELLSGIGRDGSRAHSLSEPCLASALDR
jgi:cytochrome c peroxidase